MNLYDLGLARNILRTAEGIYKAFEEVEPSTIPVPEGNSKYNEYTSFKSFMSQMVSKGIARNNRFLVLFESVPFLGVSQNDAAGDFKKQVNGTAFLTTACESASFPGINFQTQDMRMQSHIEKMVTQRTYNEVSMVFRCDSSMTEKKFFDVWNNAIQDKYTGDFSYKKDYAVDIEIVQFDEAGNSNYAVKLEQAFPLLITDMELSSNSRDDYHRVSVTFAYNKFSVVNLDKDNSSKMVDLLGSKQIGNFNIDSLMNFGLRPVSSFSSFISIFRP